MEHGGRGANRSQPSTGGMVGEDDGAHTGISAQELHTGATGKKKQIEESIANGGQRSVRVKGNPIAAGRVDGLAESGDGDFDTGTAQQIDGRDGFQFLESIRENRKGGGHAGNEAENKGLDNLGAT